MALKIDCYSPIRDLGERIRNQTVSPVDLVEACLARIAALNPTLNAFITVVAEDALTQAQIAESEVKASCWRGPLHGIPIGIKDFYDTAHIKTTAAFERFKDRVPTKDASGVTKLKSAGAVIVGKTNMHTLGMGTTGLDSYFGPVENPWNRDFIPGGSSAGSAAAVAAGLCYATLDTDAIGSCRLPAACCGVVGFKATYGLISSKGILEGEQPPDEMILWLSHPAVTTRRVDDAVLVLDVLAEQAGHEQVDLSRAPDARRHLRIGVADTYKADREVTAAFKGAVEMIGRMGFTTSEARAPSADLSSGIRNIRRDREAIAEDTFTNIDVLLLPTTTTTVPSVADARANPQALSYRNTAFANYYGLPAISVPCGLDSHGLPVGLQMVGRPRDESAVLQLAHQYEMATGYPAKHPIP
jgi:aspartyl-tRNA(Asn)/glutamyl-tRNA(Gln) amidotransferase subunit A